MTMNWVTIHVGDLEKSKAFYGAYLGLEKADEFVAPSGFTLAFYKAENGMQVELLYDKDGKSAEVQGVSMGFTTKGYDALLAEARKQGILTVEPVILGGHMECFFVADPDGVGIQIIKG